jgi:hypothetical protein
MGLVIPDVEGSSWGYPGTDPLRGRAAYLAGPMRRIEAYNFPAFESAAWFLRGQGLDVWSPAERDLENGFDPVARRLTGYEDLSEEGFDLAEALLADLSYVIEHADLVVLLDGWEHSYGAQAEASTALALGMPVFTLADLKMALDG